MILYYVIVETGKGSHSSPTGKKDDSRRKKLAALAKATKQSSESRGARKRRERRGDSAKKTARNRAREWRTQVEDDRDDDSDNAR